VTNPSANRVYPKLVFVDDDQLIEFAQFEEMDANRFKWLEELYGATESLSMEDMVDRLEQRKFMMASEEPISLTDLFVHIDKYLMRRD